jgi:hypothetical protein
MQDVMTPPTARTTPPPQFIGAEIYRGSTYGAKHPLAIPRVSTVMDLARALGWLPPSVFRTSPRAKPQALLAYHTPAYVEALQRAEQSQTVDAATRETHGLGTLSNPVFPEMFRRPATGAGGAMLAAELVLAGGMVHVPGAGTHHALPDRANGFCYLNDPVLCLMHLRRLGVRRIAYIDVDAHHPDGVEPAFVGDRGQGPEIDLEVIAGVGLLVTALAAVAVGVDLARRRAAGVAPGGRGDLGATRLAERRAGDGGLTAAGALHTMVLGRMALARSTQATLSAGSRASRASSR